MEFIETQLSTPAATFRMLCADCEPTPGFALVLGPVDRSPSVLVRIQSECLTGHVFHSLSCDCYEQLNESLDTIVAAGAGILVYLRQEGRGIGLAAKMRSYVLQKQGMDTVDANLALGFPVDARDYSLAANILTHLDVTSVSLMTNNPEKVDALTKLGIHVSDVVGIRPHSRPQNKRYLTTKVERLGHTFTIE